MGRLSCILRAHGNPYDSGQAILVKAALSTSSSRPPKAVAAQAMPLNTIWQPLTLDTAAERAPQFCRGFGLSRFFCLFFKRCAANPEFGEDSCPAQCRALPSVRFYACANKV